MAVNNVIKLNRSALRSLVLYEILTPKKDCIDIICKATGRRYLGEGSRAELNGRGTIGLDGAEYLYFFFIS
jgi:hypothetical protein